MLKIIGGARAPRAHTTLCLWLLVIFIYTFKCHYNDLLQGMVCRCRLNLRDCEHVIFSNRGAEITESDIMAAACDNRQVAPYSMLLVSYLRQTCQQLRNIRSISGNQCLLCELRKFTPLKPYFPSNSRRSANFSAICFSPFSFERKRII